MPKFWGECPPDFFTFVCLHTYTNIVHTSNFYIANSCPSTMLLSLLPLGLLTWYIPSGIYIFFPDVPAEQKAVKVDPGHSSNDFSPEQQEIGKVDNEKGVGMVEESEGDAMEDGDTTNQLEGRGNEEPEEPISKDVKRVDVDSSKNELGEEERTIEASEGEAMEDDDTTQSEGSAINQQEGEEEREEENPIIISSEEQTSERK